MVQKCGEETLIHKSREVVGLLWMLFRVWPIKPSLDIVFVLSSVSSVNSNHCRLPRTWRVGVIQITRQHSYSVQQSSEPTNAKTQTKPRPSRRSPVLSIYRDHLSIASRTAVRRKHTPLHAPWDFCAVSVYAIGASVWIFADRRAYVTRYLQIDYRRRRPLFTRWFLCFSRVLEVVRVFHQARIVEELRIKEKGKRKKERARI